MGFTKTIFEAHHKLYLKRFSK